MKTSIKIITKFLLFFACLSFTPLLSGIQATFQQFDLNLFIFNQNEKIQPIEINQFNMMDMVKKEDIPYREIDVQVPNDEIKVPINKDPKKRIYIYSTHQKEAYKDSGDVYKASYYLKELLEKKGYEVVVEDQNFTKQLNNLGLTYDQSYKISRSAINDALVEYQGFDCIIDFHRDSVPRKSTYIQSNGKNFAKMMIVLGGLSPHFEKIYATANRLFDKTNQIEKGIMKNILVREAYYNQDISENMLLIEVGSEENYYQEVLNSIQVLANALDEMMR